MLHTVEKPVETYFEFQGKMAPEQGEMARSQGQQFAGMVDTLARRAFRDHGADTLGVVLDAVAVGLTIGFVAGTMGWVALIAGGVLLAADGTAWALEMADDAEVAETTQQATVVVRWAAIIASIPDAVAGLYSVAREVPKIVAVSDKLTNASRATAARALADASRMDAEAARTQNVAVRSRQKAGSKRYAEIARRAQQRAADEARKLHTELMSKASHDLVPRLTVPTGLSDRQGRA